MLCFHYNNGCFFFFWLFFLVNDCHLMFRMHSYVPKGMSCKCQEMDSLVCFFLESLADCSHFWLSLFIALIS